MAVNEREKHPGMPRWVKAAIAVVLVVVVVLVVGKLTGVEHGPGMHGGSGGAEGHTAPPGLGHGAP